MEGLIQYIAKALVDRPEQVEVITAEVDGARVYELKVAPEDVGKVIGRDGRTVNALRTLVAAALAKKGIKARLEIRDDRKAGAANGGAHPAPEPTPSSG